MALSVSLHRYEGPAGAASYWRRGAGEDARHLAGVSLRWVGQETGKRGRKLAGEAADMSEPVLPSPRFLTQADRIPLVSATASSTIGPGLDQVVGNGNGPRYGQFQTVSRQG